LKQQLDLAWKERDELRYKLARLETVSGSTKRSAKNSARNSKDFDQEELHEVKTSFERIPQKDDYLFMMHLQACAIEESICRKTHEEEEREKELERYRDRVRQLEQELEVEREKEKESSPQMAQAQPMQRESESERISMTYKTYGTPFDNLLSPVKFEKTFSFMEKNDPLEKHFLQNEVIEEMEDIKSLGDVD